MSSPQYTLSLPLSPDAVFESYVGEAANKLQSVLERDPDSGDWFLIYGPTGTGKSHLLQALCHHVPGTSDPSGNIYLSQLGRLDPAVLKDLQSFALVCLDDVDQVLGAPEWEEALFHLLNDCKAGQTKLVLAVSQPVALLPIKLADLKSRFSVAHALETDDLSDDKKILAMQRRASHWGFDLPFEVGEFILRRSPRGMLPLMDNLKRLELETLREQRKVTIPFAKQTLQL